MTGKEKISTVSLNYLEDFMQSMAESIIIVSNDAEILAVNSATCKLLGYKEEELIGKTIGTIVKEDQFFSIEELMDDYIKNEDKIYLTKNGQEIIVNFSSSVMHDEAGNIKGVVCIALYISDHRKEKEKLRTQNAYYERVFESFSSPMVLLNNDDFVFHVNKQFIKTFGYTNEEVFGKNVDEFILPHGYAHESNQIIESLRKGEIVSLETVRQDKNGVLINVIIHTSTIMINNEKVGIYAIYHDISDLKNTEEELRKTNQKLKETTAQLVHTEKMTALGELTASIAHELNQPLNNIKIISQYLLRDIKSNRLEVEELPHDLNGIVEQVNKMAEIIDHMRIFTRRLDTMQKEKIDINKPIKDIFMLLGEQLRVHNIEVITDLNTDLPKVFAVSISLEQVFTNIIINARNAVEEYLLTDKRIEIKSYMITENEVAVSIKNNGGSIPEDIRIRIFEPFFTTKPPGKGTGLGLSISKKLIEEHNGRIEVDVNELEQTTTFTVILPIATAKGDD